MLVSELPSLLVSVWPASSSGRSENSDGGPLVVLPADDEEDGDRFAERAPEREQQRRADARARLRQRDMQGSSPCA